MFASVVLLGLIGGLVAGTASATPRPPLSHGKAPWPRPDRAMARSRAAGLTPTREEKLLYHVHAHLDVFVDGEPQVVPLGIGLKQSDPALSTKTVDGIKAYGFFAGVPCKRICVSPLHTHDETGIIHTESLEANPNTLGQFFTQWGVRLTKRCVGGYCTPKTSIRFYIDGAEYKGDPREIELTNLLEVAILIGTPPTTIPSSGDFSNT